MTTEPKAAATDEARNDRCSFILGMLLPVAAYPALAVSRREGTMRGALGLAASVLAESWFGDGAGSPR